MFPNEEFAIKSVSVPSGVSDQPENDSEIFSGARHRAGNAFQAEPGADFYVGIEGGIEEKDRDMEVFAWVVIRAKNGGFGKGKTGTFFLPTHMAELIKQGKELGEVSDIVFNKKNSKQNSGTVGILTDNVIDRTTYYTEAVVLALIPLKNPSIYKTFGV